ncbi:MAG: Nif3-like dinuclear metal center hexameric protein [Heliobacteriaceae bacterium]|nr:Nif3-like dinuclear metal center hexameric protein [Heliobacteriaceae bacterium]
MAVVCSQIIGWLERLAPKHLAAEWDAIGLQAGDPGALVTGVYLALDVDPGVVEAAVEKGCQLIVTHHPLIFKPLKALRWDLPAGWLLRRLAVAGLQVYAAHTNLDVAGGGVNDALAARLGLTGVVPLGGDQGAELVKIAVFVPADHEAVVRRALGEAGAGHIGNYAHCTFRTSGTGAFLPLDGAEPFIGRVGEVAEVAEVRVETVVTRQDLSRVLKAMLKAHPYEEVAYDLYPLLNRGVAVGLGRIGHLPEPLTVGAWAERVKTVLSVPAVRWVGRDRQRLVRKVAVCGGTGAGLLAKAKFQGADLLITGDLKYHEAQTAQNLGLDVIDPGHFATERPVLAELARYLEDRAAGEKVDLTVWVHGESQDPFTFV